jgi:hypothetical protein
MGKHSPAGEPDPTTEAWIGQPPDPMPADVAAPVIETKVTAATVWALIVGGLAAIAGVVMQNTGALDALGLPPWAVWLIAAVAPGLAALGGGYQAPHTPRQDPAATGTTEDGKGAPGG